MDEKDLAKVREIAESGVPGTIITLLELRAILAAGIDPDEITRTLGGQAEYCGCDNPDCPGVVIEANGRELVVPTFAAIADLRDMTPVEYVDSILEQRRQVVERAIELYQLIEDANEGDLEDLDLEAEDEEVVVLLKQIHVKMMTGQILATLGDIAHTLATRL
jgi:hypothetical protein